MKKTDQRWQHLLERLDVAGPAKSATRNKDILAFEAATGITLPAEYKDFCLLFGSGELRDSVSIFCPTPAGDLLDLQEHSEEHLGYLKEILAIDQSEPTADQNCVEKIFNSFMAVNRFVFSLLRSAADIEAEQAREAERRATEREKLRRVEKLLDNALLFGKTSSGHDLLWDLSSYQKKDKSYDIYLIGHSDITDTFLLCRSFFEFINDFCYGLRSSHVLPADLSFDNLDNDLRFMRFSLTSPASVG